MIFINKYEYILFVILALYLGLYNITSILIINSMNIHLIYNYFQLKFRKKRMSDFEMMFKITDDSNILDVGGTPFNWELISSSPNITLVNLSYPDNGLKNVIKKNLNFEIGDGTNLKYMDKSFEISFSNSVIEHLYSKENQVKFANELLRTGKKIYVQTPAQEFFMEPHLITPFIHWFPLNWQRKLMKNFSVWGLITRPTQKEIDTFLSERRLLSYKEFKELFPNCEIQTEKFLGMNKSYIAIKK